MIAFLKLTHQERTFMAPLGNAVVVEALRTVIDPEQGKEL